MLTQSSSPNTSSFLALISGSQIEETKAQNKQTPLFPWQQQPVKFLAFHPAGSPHRCRSYIFVGATFPRAGGKSVAADLTKRFPGMHWLEGKQLHASKRGIHHDWIRVSEDDRSEVIAAVVTALRAQRVGDTGTLGHALVFCRDTASARIMHEELQMVRTCTQLLFWSRLFYIILGVRNLSQRGRKKRKWKQYERFLS